MSIMKSNAKAFIALGLGIIFLTIAISEGQFGGIAELIEELTKSAVAGIPTP
jgi:hypothetical protein